MTKAKKTQLRRYINDMDAEKDICADWKPPHNERKAEGEEMQFGGTYLSSEGEL